ncbi:MAG: hypothetical protein JJ902_05645 [Roseibium sp.]|nr:hypothetical protein [Roseibium sp.]
MTITSPIRLLTNIDAPYDKRFPSELTDCVVTRQKPWLLTIREPLQTKAPAPPKAQPFCCYIRTIIFYHSPYIISPFGGFWRDSSGALRRSQPGSFIQWDEIKSRLCGRDVIEFEGEQFDMGSGQVFWMSVQGQRRRWWMTRQARRRAT